MPPDPAPRVGALYVDDIGRVVMAVSTYRGLYGRAMADCVPADDICQIATDAGSTIDPETAIGSTCDLWCNPLCYFGAELAEIIPHLDPINKETI